MSRGPVIEVEFFLEDFDASEDPCAALALEELRRAIVMCHCGVREEHSEDLRMTFWRVFGHEQDIERLLDWPTERRARIEDLQRQRRMAQQQQLLIPQRASPLEQQLALALQNDHSSQQLQQIARARDGALVPCSGGLIGSLGLGGLLGL